MRYINYRFPDTDHNGTFVKEDCIYRIFQFEHLLDFLLNKRLYFANPKCWEDPFENFLLKWDIFHNGKKIELKTSPNYTFGQCWSFNEETDFMWRVYAPGKNGIKVKSIVNKLCKAIDSQYKSAVFGKVQYATTEEILKDYKNLADFDLVYYQQLYQAPMFIKRTEFEPENEFRVVITKRSDDSSKDFIYVDVDPDSIIDEIIIDPRMNSDAVIKNLEIIRKNMDYSFTIKESNLYKIPVNRVDISGDFWSESNNNLTGL